MTESIPKLVRGDVVEWPDGERAKVGERFRGRPADIAAGDGRVIMVRVKLAGEFAGADFCGLLTRC
jgi:hypothetical protein